MPLRPERVVEVRYDHMEGVRFRHTAQFSRWRPDRDPRVVHVRTAGGAGAVRPGGRPGLTPSSPAACDAAYALGRMGRTRGDGLASTGGHGRPARLGDRGAVGLHGRPVDAAGDRHQRRAGRGDHAEPSRRSEVPQLEDGESNIQWRAAARRRSARPRRAAAPRLAADRVRPDQRRARLPLRAGPRHRPPAAAQGGRRPGADRRGQRRRRAARHRLRRPARRDAATDVLREVPAHRHGPARHRQLGRRQLRAAGDPARDGRARPRRAGRRRLVGGRPDRRSAVLDRAGEPASRASTPGAPPPTWTRCAPRSASPASTRSGTARAHAW